MQFYRILVLLLLNVFIFSQDLEDLSFGNENSLDIATWNIEWFPKNGQASVEYVTQIIQYLDLDILAMQELDNIDMFNQMLNELTDYTGYYESAWFAGLAYIYKTDIVQINDIYEIIYSLNLNNGFKLAIPVVFYISICKLSSALVGCVNSIITNSKYYYMVPLFSISSAIGVIFLNIFFINKIGFIGAAISTMIIIVLFNFLKLIFVMLKFKIQPFTKNTVLISILILTTYLLFYNLNISTNFLINLTIKCTLTIITYLSISYFLNLSDDLNSFLKINRKGK